MYSEADSGHCQISKMKFFLRKYLIGKKLLANFAKGYSIDVWKGPEYASKWNSIKSYKKVGEKLSLKMEIFKT